MVSIEPREPSNGEAVPHTSSRPGEPAPASFSESPRQAEGSARVELPAVDRRAELAPAPASEPGIDRGAALRALRNLEATEARLERNARREVEDARGKLVAELLPVLDNLDRTIRADTGRSDPALLEGVRLVRQQLEGVLRGFGVERIDSLGQRFDPSVHDAISTVPIADPRRDGLVVHEIEPGYRFAGRLLRAAKVGVGKLASPFGLRPASMWR
jgi:molecular chaperone GrpE